MTDLCRVTTFLLPAKALLPGAAAPPPKDVLTQLPSAWLGRLEQMQLDVLTLQARSLVTTPSMSSTGCGRPTSSTPDLPRCRRSGRPPPTALWCASPPSGCGRCSARAPASRARRPARYPPGRGGRAGRDHGRGGARPLRPAAAIQRGGQHDVPLRLHRVRSWPHAPIAPLLQLPHCSNCPFRQP